MTDIYFKFGHPEHGWLSVIIYDGDKEVELDISDVPNNAIQMLAGTLLSLQAGSEYEEVEFSLEPEYALWKFFVRDDDIEIEVFPDSGRETPVVFKCAKRKIQKRLYKGLRDLESLSIWKDPELSCLAWSWSFPSIELNRFKVKD